MRATPLLVTCLAATTLLLAACAPAPLYKPAAGTTTALPRAVAQSPAQYAGAAVIWGGRIIKVTNLPDHSEIQLLAYKLDSSQRPKTDAGAQGRFIAIVPGYLEPLDYPAGRLMTFAGRLKGVREGMVGEARYMFPLVAANDYHLWTTEELRSAWSNVHIGVGVGVGL